VGRTDDGSYVYLLVLWVAFFGMVAFPTRHVITIRSKQLGALTFVLLLVDSAVLRKI